MSIKDGYANKKVTFETEDGLEEKNDILTTMMTKLMTQDEGRKTMAQTLRYIKVREEDR